MISVITAARIDNEEKADWLLEMVGSLQAQTLKEWELLIVDDLSSHFPKLPDDERLRYFRTTENKGPAVARNTAAALAEYEAILPLDADDKLATPDTLARMFDAWS
jgi:teichuronic acid biosynthesis glycosyltransferase TuaG